VARHPETRREETDLERVDRNLQELLGELRVALPGVQVLFAFLLVVPFNTGFDRATAFQENVYLVTLLCTAAASIFLIAPSVHHRIVFRLQEKEHIVKAANRLALVGLSLMAVAITGALLLVTDFLFSPAVTAGVTAGTVVLFASVWYFIPVRRRLERDP